MGNVGLMAESKAIWAKPARAFSFTAVMVPILAGATAALYYERSLNWGGLIWVPAVALILGLVYKSGMLDKLYRGVTDFYLFLIMGPGTMLALYHSMTGAIDLNALIITSPIAFTAGAIVHVFNYRDMEQDKAAGVFTLANFLGGNGARLLYYLFLAAPYGCVALMVAMGYAELIILLVFLGLPLTMKSVTLIRDADSVREKSLAGLGALTIQLHLLFGLLLTLALLAGYTR